MCVGLGAGGGVHAWVKVAEQNHMEAPNVAFSHLPIESKLSQVGNYKDRISLVRAEVTAMVSTLHGMRSVLQADGWRGVNY